MFQFNVLILPLYQKGIAYQLLFTDLWRRCQLMQNLLPVKFGDQTCLVDVKCELLIPSCKWSKCRGPPNRVIAACVRKCDSLTILKKGLKTVCGEAD